MNALLQRQEKSFHTEYVTFNMMHIFTNLMHHSIQVHAYISFIALRLTLDENNITFDKKLQFIALNDACK